MRTARLQMAGGCLAAAAAALVACGGGEATKAGGSGPPVTLRVGTAEPVGRPSANALEEFARQAARLSGNRIRIEPVYKAVGFEGRKPDHQVARKVASGELDGGVIPARAWESSIGSMRALQTPFLLSSDALVAAVVGELGPEMLRGLEREGVVGLAMIPGGLRHPAGFGEPLVGPGDYRDAVMRVVPSETTYALFRALGAEPRDLDGPVFTRAVETGAVRGTETSFAIAPNLPEPAAVTGNVTLYARVDSLVVSRQAYDRLGEDQRRALRRAAEATATAMRRVAVPDAEAGARFCKERHGTVVTASPAHLQALERAAAPIHAELAEDPATRTAIERIRALKERQGPAATARACGPGGEPAPEAQSGGTPADLNGVYRFELPVDYLLERGVRPGQAREESGVHTVVLRDGQWIETWRNSATAGECRAGYTLRGKAMTVRWTEGCEGDWRMTLTRDGKRIRWRDIRALPPFDSPYEQRLVEAFLRVPWTKVG